MNELIDVENKELDILVQDKIAEVVDQAVQEGSPDKAFSFGSSLLKIYNASDKGLAKLAFTLKDRWPEFNIDSPFEDVAIQWWNVTPITLRRYIRAYDLLQSGEIPEQFQDKVEEMPMRELVPLATAWASGFPITEDKWQEIVEADNFGEFQETMREIKNEEPRVSAFAIRLSRDGTLKAYAGKGNGVFVGYLAVEEAKEDETVQKAINRIVSGANIIVE